MKYFDELKQALHQYSVITTKQKIKLCNLHPKKDIIKNNYYLYHNLHYAYHTLDDAKKASLRMGIKLCLYPTKYLNTKVITKTDLDEMNCLDKHIHYYNDLKIVNILLEVLGDETINDRYNYDLYLKQEHNYPKLQKIEEQRLHYAHKIINIH